MRVHVLVFVERQPAMPPGAPCIRLQGGSRYQRRAAKRCGGTRLTCSVRMRGKWPRGRLHRSPPRCPKARQPRCVPRSRAEPMRHSGYAAGAARGARRAPLPISLPSTVHARAWQPERPRRGPTTPSDSAPPLPQPFTRAAERLRRGVSVQPLGWVDAGLRVPSLRVSWALCGSLSGCQGLAWTVRVRVLGAPGQAWTRRKS